MDRKTSNALLHLCSRPYWQRLWVVQELRHARDVRLMCGPSVLDRTQFMQYFNGGISFYDITSSRTTIDVIVSPVARMLRFHTKMTTCFLVELLAATKDLLCTDHRDRVYAILSIAATGAEGIRADYLAPLELLGSQVLRNEYKIYLPKSMSKVRQDCEFLSKTLGTDAEKILDCSKAQI
jgi:hypothetical protein